MQTAETTQKLNQLEMKTTEQKPLTETQKTVLGFIEKFLDTSPEMVTTVTGINKPVVCKAANTLAANGLIKIIEESDGPIYQYVKPEGNTIHAHVKTSSKPEVIIEEKNTNVSSKKSTKKEPVKTETTKKVMEDEAVLPKTGSRDTSKLKFNGELYGKGRLVLAVVKKYIEDNPKTTLAKLKEVFPDELQPRYGMLQEVSKAKKISADRDRYFLKPEDLIKVGDKKIAVCNQFGSHNLPLKHFKSLGFVIK